LGMVGGQPETGNVIDAAMPAVMTTTSQLMHRASTGETEAWSELVDRLAPSVWRSLRAYGLAPDDEAGVWRAVWVRLADNLPELRSDQLERWLDRVILRETQRLLRLNSA
jgi:DNA-directed RNA polymerase specialized sigma24 family protein